MARVRFLQSVILIPYGKTFGFNDELDIQDEELVEDLVKNGIVDVFLEEENEPKSAKKPRKTAQNNPKMD